MPTDKTPRDADETLALPVTDQEPATDDTAVIEADDTVAATTDDTAVLTLDDRPTAAEGGNTTDTAVLALDTPPAAVEGRPAADETRSYPSTSAWSSQDEPAAYTSPIGALYAPSERPDPAPTDRLAPDPVAESAPVVEPVPADPPRRLRVGTVVWGLVIAAIGVGLLAWAAGFAIDLQLAMIVLLAVAGTALLVGSIVSGARNARR